MSRSPVSVATPFAGAGCFALWAIVGGLSFTGVANLSGIAVAAEPTKAASRGDGIKQIDPQVLSDEARAAQGEGLWNDLRRRREAINKQSRAEWAGIKSREEWEAYRDQRLARLWRSLGTFPEPPQELSWHVTGEIPGDGFVIRNVVYQTRPDFWVTANLYVPAKPGKNMPGMIICHAHHRPKTQGELQDMGMTWARAGAVVLVLDQIGYGERAVHPFRSERDYAKDYPISRQDYHFRYDSGSQLYLIGDSLMGWMVWDLMRSVDLLLAQPGVDPTKLVILGSVAGGGDPAGVTAALEKRIDVAVPFNFGGPQPETQYPLPEDAEATYNYLPGAYWESTRNLRRTGADGFLHWVIVGGIAPRGLIYGHEFAWDQPRDPVYKRYEKIWGDFYGKRDLLDYAHGYGVLKQRPPQASHCTMIGPPQRKRIHPYFQKWLGLETSSETEYQNRVDSSQLMAMTDATAKKLKPRNLLEVAGDVGRERAAVAMKEIAGNSPAAVRAAQRERWSAILGNVEPEGPAKVVSNQRDANGPSGVVVDRVALEVEPGITVTAILLSGKDFGQPKKRPVVVAVAQAGAQAFLQQRSEMIVDLIRGGAAIALVDVRGAGRSRGSYGDSGGLSHNVLLHDETMVGQRLRDLRSVLGYLRTRDDLDSSRLAIWGASFAKVNSADTDFQIPHRSDSRPPQSEPLGGLLALLTALYEDEVQSVYIQGGLGTFQSVLDSPYVLIPHDTVIPGVLGAGDLPALAAAVAPRPLLLVRLVDQLNRPLSAQAARTAYAPALAARQAAGGNEFSIKEQEDQRAATAWLSATLHE